LRDGIARRATWNGQPRVADLSELSFRHRLQLAAYRWRRLDPVPGSAPKGPLSATRLALVTSAGLYRAGIDPPFQRIRGGDVSFRVIPNDVAVASLSIGQTSDAFDRAPVETDRNIALPLDRLHELVRAGEVGSAAPRHLSFNGSITAPGRLVAETAPEAAELLRADGTDAALLVPV
jgi:D-proline reductase (dithiol) PrdB